MCRQELGYLRLHSCYKFLKDGVTPAMYQLAIWLELLICRFRAYIGDGCGIVSPVLLDEYVITRDKDTESMRYGGSNPPMTQKNHLHKINLKVKTQ